MDFGIVSKVPNIQNVDRLLRWGSTAKVSVSLTQNAEVETGVVCRDNIDAVGQHIRAESADDLSPRRQANVAILQHSSVVGEVLTRIKRPSFLGSVIFLDKPVTLKRNITALVCDAHSQRRKRDPLGPPFRCPVQEWFC